MRLNGMHLIRVAAGAILLVIGPEVLGPSPLLAAKLGGCSPASDAACITRHEVYENMSCTSGGGTDCIGCIKQQEHVCTWEGGDALDYYN